MQHKVDYLSYTYYDAKLEMTHSTRMHYALVEGLPSYIDRPDIWVEAPKRTGFRGGFNQDNHTFVFYNDQGLVLIEHTGAGCDLLYDRGVLLQVITERAARLTRIDIATDIETQTRPSAFVSHSEAGRIKARGFQSSKSGETCYVGSKTSDRCCKVYRYDGEHPRSHLLRVEYTYRKEQARIIGDMLKTLTIKDIALRSSTRYQWQAECWKMAVNGSFEGIKAFTPERRHGKTVAWIYSQVIPAIVKLVKCNVLDLEEIIDEIRKQAQA